MPCKHRVLFEQIEYTPQTSELIKNWKPSNLDSVISELCNAYDINFINLTEVLKTETKRKKLLLYNSIFDTHLNSIGSRVVGQDLARQVKNYSKNRNK